MSLRPVFNSLVRIQHLDNHQIRTVSGRVRAGETGVLFMDAEFFGLRNQPADDSPDRVRMAGQGGIEPHGGKCICCQSALPRTHAAMGSLTLPILPVFERHAERKVRPSVHGRARGWQLGLGQSLAV